MRFRNTAIAVIGLLAIVGIAAVAISPNAPRQASAVPSDADMIAHWQQHRATLDQITDMLRRDPALNRLGLDWSDPEDPERAHVPAPRIADYRDLMREASVLRVSRGHRSVQFLFFAGGPALGGVGKSFVRGEASRHAEIVDTDLDKAAEGRTKILLQRPIADGWWLQRDSN